MVGRRHRRRYDDGREAISLDPCTTLLVAELLRKESLRVIRKVYHDFHRSSYGPFRRETTYALSHFGLPYKELLIALIINLLMCNGMREYNEWLIFCEQMRYQLDQSVHYNLDDAEKKDTIVFTPDIWEQSVEHIL